MILREAIQDAGESFSNFTTMYEVWPSVKRTTFSKVDTLAKQVIDTLNRKRFEIGGVPHYIEYTGTTGEDVVHEEWNLITRGLRFQVYSLAWLVRSLLEPDPVKGMEAWTNKRFSNIQTSPGNWNPQDDSPALYWRLTNITSVQPMSWGTWIDANLAGHLINPDTATRNRWLEMVVQQLARDAKTILSDGSKMIFQSVSADSEQNPFSSGQISLSVRFGILNATIDYERLNNIHLNQPGGVIYDS